MEEAMKRSTVTVAVFTVVVVAAAATDQPCLPDQWQADFKDYLGRSGVVAADFNKGSFGMRRPPQGKLVKMWNQETRYDITPESCKSSTIPSTPDFPKCVPDNAVAVVYEGTQAWSFANIDGATLIYSDTRPAVVLRKLSPSKKGYVAYHNQQSSVTDPNVFKIPGRC